MRKGNGSDDQSWTLEGNLETTKGEVEVERSIRVRLENNWDLTGNKKTVAGTGRRKGNDGRKEDKESKDYIEETRIKEGNISSKEGRQRRLKKRARKIEYGRLTQGNSE